MMNERLNPVKPGDVLKEDFLGPMGITPYRIAKAIGVPPTRIGDIIDGKRAITAETALLFSKFFGTSAALWLNLQAQYDLEKAEHEMHDRLNSIQTYQEIAKAA